MKTLKDENILYYTIKIRRIREVKGDRNYREYKDKLYCIDCRDYIGAGFAFCEPTLRRAINTLKKQLYL